MLEAVAASVGALEDEDVRGAVSCGGEGFGRAADLDPDLGVVWGWIRGGGSRGGSRDGGGFGAESGGPVAEGGVGGVAGSEEPDCAGSVVEEDWEGGREGGAPG